jgi:hypothetical protein
MAEISVDRAEVEMLIRALDGLGDAVLTEDERIMRAALAYKLGRAAHEFLPPPAVQVTEPAKLTARAVKAMLTRAGVDCSALEIRDDPAVWRDLSTGRTSTSVIIEGPKELRHAASHVLWSAGLSRAPYPDHDAWSRR